jgi:hypothetical protein
MPSVTIKIRRGTSSQWSSSTRPLAAGELGLDTTLNKIKAGNGTSLWPVLPFLSVIPSEITELAQDAIDSALVAGTGVSKTYNDVANTITLAVDSTIASKLYVDAAIAALDDTVSVGYIPVSLLGNPEGVAELDLNGFVPDSQIPATIARDTEITSAISTEATNRNTAIATEVTNRNTAIATAKSEAIADATAQVNALLTGAPAALNTLDELAAALGDDANYAATITTALGNKLNSSTAAETYLSISEPSVDYYVTNSGSGSYLVNGVSNGLITFEKGKKYRIHVNAAGHPFWIQTVSGAYSLENVYSTGVTNGGAQSGHILVELPQSAPDNLYYACQFHSSMAGSISVRSEDAITINSKSASYTIAPIDSGRLIEMSAGGTVTIADSVLFPVGYSVDILQTGTSQVTIAGDGFTPNSTPGLKLRAQWSSATLIKRALNSWVILGDLSV